MPRLPVAGVLGGQSVATTVDSPIAKYYLEHYLRGDRSNHEFDRAISEVLQEPAADPSDAAALTRLSRRFSADFATIYFAARLYDMPANHRAHDAFHAHLRQLTASAAGRTVPAPNTRESYLFAFVPGYVYKKDRTTGADFARQREIMTQFGFQTLLIETNEIGSVEANSAIVANQILRLTRQHHRLILISASKGSPEVALALGERLSAEQLRDVHAWISVGGLLRGSPYADQALRWPRRWLAQTVLAFQGLPPSVIKDMSTAVRNAVFGRLKFPPHILMLQYVGAPLSGHIVSSTKSRYDALRPLGPNDGLTLLADELIPGGIAVTDVGLDHYYRDPVIERKTLALAYVVLDELGP